MKFKEVDSAIVSNSSVLYKLLFAIVPLNQDLKLP
jgi:hypothetical protein